MTTSRDFSVLKAGDVAYFVKLHLDTLKPIDKHPNKPSHWVYRVEGKRRPMLIYEVKVQADGHRTFVVFPIRSQDKHGGTGKPNRIRLENLLKPKKVSYLEKTCQELPQNMFHPLDSNWVVKSLERLAFDNIKKMLGKSVLEPPPG